MENPENNELQVKGRDNTIPFLCSCREDSHFLMVDMDMEFGEVWLTEQYRGRVRDRLGDVWRLLTGQAICRSVGVDVTGLRDVLDSTEGGRGQEDTLTIQGFDFKPTGNPAEYKIFEGTEYLGSCGYELGAYFLYNGAGRTVSYARCPASILERYCPSTKNIYLNWVVGEIRTSREQA